MPLYSEANMDLLKLLMAEWLKQASQWCEMYYHDVMMNMIISSNPGRGEIRVHSTFALNHT